MDKQREQFEAWPHRYDYYCPECDTSLQGHEVGPNYSHRCSEGGCGRVVQVRPGLNAAMDYRKLLKDYMAWVLAVEGTTFLTDSQLQFTPEEHNELLKIEAEVLEED